MSGKNLTAHCGSYFHFNGNVEGVSKSAGDTNLKTVSVALLSSHLVTTEGGRMLIEVLEEWSKIIHFYAL